MDGQLAAIEAARSAEELLKAVKGVQRLLPSCARFSAEQAAAQAAAVGRGARSRGQCHRPLLRLCDARGPYRPPPW